MEMFRVPFPVAECSNYQDRRLPRFVDLEEIALPIEIKGRSAGFVNSEVADIDDGDDRQAGFAPAATTREE